MAEIDGRTEIGRATVERLHFNAPKQVAARKLWITYFGVPAGPTGNER
jgi:hypothetical protein